MHLIFIAVILACLLAISAYASDEKPRYQKDDYRYNRASAETVPPTAAPPAYRDEGLSSNQLDSSCQSGDLAACAKLKQYQDEARHPDNDTAIIPAKSGTSIMEK